MAVEGLEPHPAGGEGIEMGRADGAAAIAQIGIAEMVRQDHHDVGPWGGGWSCRRLGSWARAKSSFVG